MTTLILSGILGFLLASLIALLLAPPLWRRAVGATTKKLHEQSPRTMNEGQADRDVLRAEFAVATRKLEVRYKQIKDKSAAQRIENSKLEEKKSNLEAIVINLSNDLELRDRQISKLNEQRDYLLAKLQERDTKYTKSLTKQTQKKSRIRKLSTVLKRQSKTSDNENKNKALPPQSNASQSPETHIPAQTLRSDNSNHIQPTTTPKTETMENNELADSPQENQSLAERIRSLQKDRT